MDFQVKADTVFKTLEPVFDDLFEFAIGDLVYVRSAGHSATHIPKQFVVTERFAQQCHGGFQLQYKLHGYPESGNVLVPELVLTRERPDYEWRDKQAQLELLDQRRREYEQDAEWRQHLVDIEVDAIRAKAATRKEQREADDSAE